MLRKSLTFYLLLQFSAVLSMDKIRDVLERNGGLSSTGESQSDVLSSPIHIKSQLDSQYDDIKNGLLIGSFNVGQGTFSIIRNMEQNVSIIVDCGSISQKWEEFSVEKGMILRNFIGNSLIKAFVITHPDRDHYNYVLPFWREFQDKIAGKDQLSLVIGGDLADGEFKRIFSKIFLVKIQSNTCSYFLNGKQTSLRHIEDALNNAIQVTSGIKFLNPGLGTTKRDKNTQSLVFCLNFRGNNLLFTGDATGATFNAISNRNLLKKVNFLMVPHHGSHTQNSPIWQNKVVESSGDNFVGSLIPIDARNQRDGLPTKTVTDYRYPLSAQSNDKRKVFRYLGKKKGLKFVNTHRQLYEVGNALYGVFLLHLGDNLSVFDDNCFATGKRNFLGSFSSLTFQGISLFSLFCKLGGRIINLSFFDADDALYLACFAVKNRIITVEQKPWLKTMLDNGLSKFCEPFFEIAKIYACDKLTVSEEYYRGIINDKFNLDGALQCFISEIFPDIEIVDDEQIVSLTDLFSAKLKFVYELSHVNFE